MLIQQIKLILNESITNAIKHGGATTIDLTFEVEDNTLYAFIKDNGYGFNKKTIQEAGIANMRDRVKRLGGTFKIESAIGEGARLLLTIPL